MESFEPLERIGQQEKGNLNRRRNHNSSVFELRQVVGCSEVPVNFVVSVSEDFVEHVDAPLLLGAPLQLLLNRLLQFGNLGF